MLEYLLSFKPRLELATGCEPGNSRIVDKWIAMYDEGGEFEHRQFGITENGFLTVGPRAMKAGDIICLLHGGELPYVLRPLGDDFLFIGECYVHHLRQPLWEYSEDVEEEWFSLR